MLPPGKNSRRSLPLYPSLIRLPSIAASLRDCLVLPAIGHNACFRTMSLASTCAPSFIFSARRSLYFLLKPLKLPIAISSPFRRLFRQDASLTWRTGLGCIVICAVLRPQVIDLVQDPAIRFTRVLPHILVRRILRPRMLRRLFLTPRIYSICRESPFRGVVFPPSAP